MVIIMNNKILIRLYVPHLSKEFEVLIPVNERVGKIVEKLKKTIYELSDQTFEMNRNYNLIDSNTGTIYEYNNIIRDTNIKHAKKLILI